jgi:predicted nucleotidyltransferase
MTIHPDHPRQNAPSRSVPDVALRIADRLSAVPGIAAVALGGSRARDDGDERSDIDLGLYYHGDTPPTIAALSRLAEELDDSGGHDLVVPPGGWGPWIDGGAWLTVGGQRVDWIYRNLETVSRTIAECLDGITSCHYQPGHPHGFHTHIHMGEVHHAVPLHDPSGVLTTLQRLTTPYPVRLQTTIVGRYLWEADFALACSRTSARRGDVAYVTGNLWRSVACLIQVLFAANARYFLNEKGAVAAIEGMPMRPEYFVSIVQTALAQPGSTPATLAATIAQLDKLTSAVRNMVSR